ncbi:hypothetical protein [Flavobacterium sp.]|uniref:hypothetical protein n=1 Tax=Flavobacterium sp. TaxID=239 RepID=UPI002620BC20|nr:hypothetical protein [Flavobacterium sp.]
MKWLLCFCCISLVLFSGFSKVTQSVLVEIYGDLDRDKIDEKITVVELNEEGNDGKIRVLNIFKKKNNQWKLWHSSNTAILGSEGGGMMGDPFFDKSIGILNGVITIDHNGGSSWKWSTVHKYRLKNNEFELIGYSTHYGKLCEYWAEFDYNLSTGKINYKKEYETCDEKTEDSTISKVEDEVFYKKLKKLPNLKNINKVQIKITTPKYKEELIF